MNPTDTNFPIIAHEPIHPLAANWMITYKCTNKCSICLTDSSMSKQIIELSAADKIKVIEVLASLGVKRISIMGGEPFILDEIDAVAQAAYLNGIIFNLTTSGTGCNYQKLQRIRNNLQYLNVSIDGQEEYHNRIRENGSFSLACQAVCDAAKSQIPVRLYQVLTVYNIDRTSIEWTFKFASDNGVFLIMFIFMSPTGRASEHWNYRVQPEKRAPILSFIKEMSDKYHVAFKSCDPYLPENYKLFIESNGSVYKHAGSGNKEPLGNIINQPDGRFWHNLSVTEQEQHWTDFEGIKKLNPLKTNFHELSPENMVYIHPGIFYMGSDFRKREQPVHQVYLDGFFIDQYQVSNKQYADFLNKSRKSVDEIRNWINLASNFCLIEYLDNQYQAKKGFDKYPVVEVSWYGANSYALWAGKRLPTEAEWVKAALGGNNKNCYPWGNSEPSEQCNWLKYKGEFKDLRPDFYHERGPLPVGLFNPNEYGIYDMAGNVWEWCQDWFDNNYFTTDLMINPKGPESGTKKVLKGGSWSFDPVNLRIQNRSFAFPDSGYPYDGFRCVCSAIDLLTKKNNQE